MKKQKCMILLVALLLSLTACNEAKEVVNENVIKGCQSLQVNEILKLIDDETMATEILTSKAIIHDIAWAVEEFEKEYIIPDFIFPIHHTFTQYQSDFGTLIFLMQGYNGISFETSSKAIILSIEIWDSNGEYYQLLDGFSTLHKYNSDEKYGLLFADFNDDGYFDLQLHHYEGARCEMNLHFFGYGIMKALCDNNFVMNSYVHYYGEIADDDILYWVTETFELIDGEMQVTDIARERIES